ncbi:MAG: hypothetical protein ABIG61_15460, partial [Planctomycetota bacterium]
LSIATGAVTVGGTAQDVDFGWYATGSKSFVLDAGAGTLTIAGVDVTMAGGGTSLSIGACTGHPISLTGTWGQGILGAAINIGDYSNPIAFGTSTDHVIGIVSHIGVDLGAGFNAIPILGKITTSGDAGALAVGQCVLGQGVVAHDLADMYGVRGSIAISGAPEVNQLFSVFATMTTTACNMADTGMIALYGGKISGTTDITKTSGYAAVCGMYLSWEETNAMTVDTNGILLNIASGSRIDSGVVVHLDGAGTSIGSSFKSYRDGGTITTALDIEGAHTNAFAFPVAGTAPTTTAATAMNGLTSEGYVTVLVGGAAKKMYYFA